jgi:hypothetical protein
MIRVRVRDPVGVLSPGANKTRNEKEAKKRQLQRDRLRAAGLTFQAGQTPKAAEKLRQAAHEHNVQGAKGSPSHQG